MSVGVRLWRSFGRSLVLVVLFIHAGMQLIVRRPETRVDRAMWLHQFCARAMKRLGMRIEVVGPVPERGVVISNHLGYLDIVTFAALHACVFCSKAEIEHWPILGWMTTMAGTVYVQRGRGGSAAKAASGMRAASEAGLPVVFFPEGTTSNGSCLLKFHSGLLAQALLSEQPITAAFVGYRLDDENGSDVSVADDVCYWGERNLLAHIFKLLGLRGIVVRVRFAEGPIPFSSDSLHRKRAAVEAQAAVAGIADKWKERESPRR